MNNLVTDCTTTPHHQIEGAFGQILPGNNFGQRPGAGRYQIGRLKDHRIAEGQRWRNLPDRRRHGKIPGANDRDDSHGLAPGLNFDPRAH